MKANNIFSLIVDGADGCGKTSLNIMCQKRTNFELLAYDRGELSYYVYAKKFNRPFVPTMRGLPICIVFLKCDQKVLRERIIDRAKREKWPQKDLDKELAKVQDEALFEQAAKDFERDYHIITIDVSYKTTEEAFDELIIKLKALLDTLPVDKQQSNWNVMYEKGCQRLGLDFKVRNNQPYINDIPFMSESTCQNGVYEKFDIKDYPTNFIFARGYDITLDACKLVEKTIDFSYIINSKIKRRPEIYDYFDEMRKFGKTCLISDNELMPQADVFIKMPKVFGNQFVMEQAKAKATVYCARDLAYLELQTARLYEAILAHQVIFVDEQSDPKCKMLSQIHDKDICKMLTVTPETFIEQYERVMSDDILVEYVISKQLLWYKNLLETVKGGKFNAKR